MVCVMSDGCLAEAYPELYEISCGLEHAACDLMSVEKEKFSELVEEIEEHLEILQGIKALLFGAEFVGIETEYERIEKLPLIPIQCPYCGVVGRYAPSYLLDTEVPLECANCPKELKHVDRIGYREILRKQGVIA